MKNLFFLFLLYSFYLGTSPKWNGNVLNFDLFLLQDDSYGVPRAALVTGSPQPSSTTTSYIPPTSTAAATSSATTTTSFAQPTSQSTYSSTSENNSPTVGQLSQLVSSSTTASMPESPTISPTTYHPSITTLPRSNGHNGPDGDRAVVVRTNEPLEQNFEQKSEGMSQSINLRINVLLGDLAGPVRASIVQDQLPGKKKKLIN